MENLTKKVVKKKKLLYSGNGHVLVIPKKWLDELGWNRKTELVLEFLPHRHAIIVSGPGDNDEEVSDIVPV